VLIDWDYCASGIWHVTTLEELTAPAPRGRWTGAPPADRGSRPRAWSDKLSGGLLDDLQEWNDAWDHRHAHVDAEALQERGRALAVRVQAEFGTQGWEVFYKMGGRVHRVQPPGSWPAESWEQELLGYPPRRRRDSAGS
jgi:hypothetical protein